MTMKRIAAIGPWLRERWLESIMALGLMGLVAWYATLGYGFIPKPPPTPTPEVKVFEGTAAYQHVVAQTEFGPRPTGSEAHKKTGDYVIEKLTQMGWQIEEQAFTYRGVSGRNIIGKAGSGPILMVGAHYDTRRRADNDPDPAKRVEPVLGANDGASGVAVLLELARSLDKKKLTNEVWLTFFDAEDNGGLDGWELIAGSRYMAQNLKTLPKAVIVVDMIGDADQQIYKERNSSAALQDKLWAVASKLGYEKQFIPEYKWAMTDDHTPFLQKGILAVDLIDFDYPYWHTTQDTRDKVAPASLERVGRGSKDVPGDSRCRVGTLEGIGGNKSQHTSLTWNLSQRPASWSGWRSRGKVRVGPLQTRWRNCNSSLRRLACRWSGHWSSVWSVPTQQHSSAPVRSRSWSACTPIPGPGGHLRRGAVTGSAA